MISSPPTQLLLNIILVVLLVVESNSLIPDPTGNKVKFFSEISNAKIPLFDTAGIVSNMKKQFLTVEPKIKIGLESKSLFTISKNIVCIFAKEWEKVLTKKREGKANNRKYRFKKWMRFNLIDKKDSIVIKSLTLLVYNKKIKVSYNKDTVWSLLFILMLLQIFNKKLNTRIICWSLNS